MIRHQVKAVIFVVAVHLVIGCEDKAPKENAIIVDGTAQKGPFVTDAQITITKLTGDGTATDQIRISNTVNNNGDFQFQVDGPGIYQVNIDDRFFNEITGRIADGPLSLHAITVIGTSGSRIYINILTHLIHGRVRMLLQDGVSIAEAMATAKAELVKSLAPVLRIADPPDPEQISNFEALSIYTSGPDTVGNAYLLAISAAAVQYAMNKSKQNNTSTVSELGTLLSLLSDDLAPDGDIDQIQILRDLRSATWQLDPAKIQSNLQSRLTANSPYRVSTMKPFVDPGVEDKTLLQVVMPAMPVSAAVPLSVSMDAVAQNLGIVSNVRYVVNGEVVGESDIPPYKITWNPYYWSGMDQVELDVSYRYSLTGSFVPLRDKKTIRLQQANNAIELKPGDASGPLPPKILLQWWAGYHGRSSHVQLWAEDNPGNMLIDEIVPGQRLLTPVLADGVYHWRVQSTLLSDVSAPWSSVHRFTVETPKQPYADLAILDLNAYQNTDPTVRDLVLTDYDYLEVTAIVANLGSQDVGPFSVYFYLSEDSVFDVYALTEYQIPGLSAGQSESISFYNKLLYLLPSPIPKRYYVLGSVDNKNEISEVDDATFEATGNNSMISPPITILPTP